MATYIKNRSPHSKLDLTPVELYTGKRPNLNELRLFGEACYVHVEHASKLEDTGSLRAFLGCSSTRKACILWDPTTGKTSESVHVSFGKDYRYTHEVLDSYPPEYSSPELDFEFSPTVDLTHAPVPVLPLSPQEPPVSSNKRITVDNAAVNPLNNLPYRRRALRAVSSLEPRTYQEIADMQDASDWYDAVDAELASLNEHHTWDVVPLPVDANLVCAKWVFRLKRDSEGKVHRYKARLVARGFSQVEGENFDEVYSPVAWVASLRCLLAIAASLDLEIEHLNV
jgi:Reverse transcriptase (RNA-dependent DNA polymerase)